MEVEPRRRNFREEIKGISPGCVSLSSPSLEGKQEFRHREEEFGSKVSALPTAGASGNRTSCKAQGTPTVEKKAYWWADVELVGRRRETFLDE